MRREEFTQIIESLEANDPALVALDLSRKDLTTQQIQLLSEALENNQILKDLNLSFNHIDLDGAVSIAKMIKKNTTLKSLNLHFCCIRNVGVEIIAAALRENNVLEELNLANNGVGPESVLKIVTALEGNYVLRILILSGIRLAAIDTQGLVKALQKNYVLEKIDGLDAFGIKVDPILVNEPRSMFLQTWANFCAIGLGIFNSSSNLTQEEKEKFKLASLPSPEERNALNKAGKPWVPPALMFSIVRSRAKDERVKIELPAMVTYKIADMLGVTRVRQFTSLRT